MATVILCDRCKREINARGIYSLKLVNPNGSLMSKWDLCDNCRIAATGFMKVPNGNDKTK